MNSWSSIDTDENQGLPRGNKAVDPAKIERMRKNLGPQDPVEEEENEKPALRIQTAPNAPQQKTKAPAPKPAINVKDNSPPPEIHRNSNNGKVADSILEFKRKKQPPQQDQPQQRKPAAPKRPSPRQPIQEEWDEEEEEEIEVRPAPQKSGKKPQPQGSSLKQPSEKSQTPSKSPKQQPEKKQPQGKQPQGKQQRPSSKKQAPAPEENEGANQQSPQTSKPGGGEKKQKPKPGKPKLPSPGPSKFQNKKAEKFGGPKVAPQPSQDDGDEEESFSAPRPAPKKQPQISPDISQGGPKDRSDGSNPRKQAGAKPNGSKFRKQGPVSEDDDYDYDVQGSERAAKDAVQSAGAPRNGPGPSQYRKGNNAPRTKNQATAKRPDSQPGAAEVVAEDTTGAGADQPKAGGGGGGDNYFKWFRASEQRPTDFVASNRDDWKTKYPVPTLDTKPEAPPPAPPAIGIEKLPSNQRQREKEQQEAAQKEQNRRASRRENF